MLAEKNSAKEVGGWGGIFETEKNRKEGQRNGHATVKCSQMHNCSNEQNTQLVKCSKCANCQMLKVNKASNAPNVQIVKCSKCANRQMLRVHKSSNAQNMQNEQMLKCANAQSAQAHIHALWHLKIVCMYVCMYCKAVLGGP